MTLVVDPSSDAQGGIIPGVSPQVYSARDFAQVSELAHTHTGIVLDESKRMLVYSRLAPHVRRSGCQTFAEFLALLARDSALIAKTLAALTTNHTYFHREAHHFDFVAEHLRAPLTAKAKAGQAVRIWSAGCSSGEEIWNLMMVLLGPDRSAGKAFAHKDVLALATDLAPHALETAQNATYPEDALENLETALLANWCEPVGRQLRIVSQVRDLVRFRELNLLGEWPMSGQFDVIFCRNVMIYFDQPTKDRLVRRLAEQLKPGGHLFIGHSERIGSDTELGLETLGPTIYRRRS
ncbi:CheR family methyltransferase [Altererythrobacter lutimaris]|uniref:Chemotaxis protein methyltransferase n=1 Tax=Altererythrobacter lutimaris TaxID=2743979 RepID=A0A850H822_9SPHN|nr:protein-glutamate O-methyltransferase CheR [Altererythrobacter lutimaris]NVE95317.1 protein-glutamate O-methyltransferase CheR [Altererythrobacter lutimaris]